MKSARQLAILEIIQKKNVETQEELAKLLQEKGFQVTQATVSRDIKELRLMKILDASGGYCYAPSAKGDFAANDRLLRVLRDTIVSIQSAYNQIVLKTMVASADIAAEAIDNLEWPQILGTIAGENTVLLILQSIEDVPEIVRRLSEMVSIVRE